MDETDFQIDQTTSNYVIFDSVISRSITSTSDNTQWVFTIECINTERVIKSYLIFVNKNSKNHMFLQNKELSNVI